MASSEYRFTLGFTYYEDPELLQQQIDIWKKYPSLIEIVVVDDGSSKFPAENLLKDLKILPTLRLYKINEDLGFNSHGCRNLIAAVASSDTVIFSDIDCQFSPNDIGYLRTVSFLKDHLYKFASYSTFNSKYNSTGHVNVFAVHKDKFWEAGGYDESFTGWHYGDREFLNRLSDVTIQKSLAPISCALVRGKRETIIDANLLKAEYNNYTNTLKVPLKDKKYSEMLGTVKTKLNFSYTQVL